MDVARVLPIEGPAPATEILISGPSRTGKFELMLHLLAHYTDSVIFISTKEPAETVIEEHRSAAGEIFDGQIGVVDCVPRPEPDAGTDTNDLVSYVGSTGNLTRIGVQFTELMELIRASRDSGHVGVGFHSLTPLLMDTSAEQVYQFLHVFTGQLRTAGSFGVAVLDTTVGDTEAQQLLWDHFDGVVETRVNDEGDRERRERGFTPQTSDWRRF